MRPIDINSADQRVEGERPAPARALFAAVVTAAATGVFAYRLLRSGA